MPKRKGPGGKRPGAGRPKTYPDGYVSRTLSLDKRADDKINKHAKEHGISRSQAASVLVLR